MKRRFDLLADVVSLIEPNIQLLMFALSFFLGNIFSVLFGYGVLQMTLLFLFIFTVVIPYIVLLREYIQETSDTDTHNR